MIRVNKPIQLLEWGKGTNTTNQIWTVAGTGKISDYKVKAGLTTLYIDIDGGFSKKNGEDNSLKLAQQGEGMTANSGIWGEVGTGVLRSVEDGGRRVLVDINTAIKVDGRR